MIDGYVERSHAALQDAHIEQASSPPDFERSSVADRHATALTSLLVGRGPFSVGLCAEARVISHPAACAAFVEGSLAKEVLCRRIAISMRACIEAGADVLLLSMEFAPDAGDLGGLMDAVRWAGRRGVRTVVAAGNHFRSAMHPLLLAPEVVVVAAARLTSTDGASSQPLDPRIHVNGVSAPGDCVSCAWLPNGYRLLDGSSVAAALVAGAFAWLRRHVAIASANEIWHALLRPSRREAPSLVPPHIDLERSLRCFDRNSGELQ